MRTRKAVVNISIGMVGLLITTVAGFIGSSAFARNLGVEISGLNNVLTNIIAFLSVTELGIAGAINYNLYKPVHERDFETISKIMAFYRKCYAVIGAVILTVSLVLAFFVHYFLKDSTLSREYVSTAFLLCAANTVLSYYLAYNRNLLYVFQEGYIANIVDMCCRVVSTTIQVVSLILFKNFHLYLAINLCTTVVSNVIITLITRSRYSQVKTNKKTKDKALQHKVLNDVKSLAVIQIGSAMTNYTSSVIISKLIGILIAGMYAYYSNLITMLTNIIGMVFSNLGASIGNLLAEGQKDNERKVFRILTHFSFMVALIVASGLGNAIQPFIELWVGAEFLLDYKVVVVLALNFFIMVQRQLVAYFLRSGGHHAHMIKPMIIEAVINISASILLGMRFGLIGIFLGVAISSLMGTILNAKVFCDCFSVKFIRYMGGQLLLLGFFVAQIFVSQWVISGLKLECGLLMQFVIYGLISVAIPVAVCVIDLLFAPSLESVRQMLLRYVKK